jgi:hypothetical protein
VGSGRAALRATKSSRRDKEGRRLFPLAKARALPMLELAPPPPELLFFSVSFLAVPREEEEGEEERGRREEEREKREGSLGAHCSGTVVPVSPDSPATSGSLVLLDSGSSQRGLSPKERGRRGHLDPSVLCCSP